MRLLGVNCSPREVNSYGVLRLMMDSVEMPGIDKKIISLGDYALEHCRGCCACLFRAPYECIQTSDGLGAIQDEFFAADGFIFSLPVYIMTVPGILKTFIDRCTNWSHVYPFAGKYGAIVTTLAAPASVARGTIDYMRSWLRLLGIVVSGELAIFTRGGYGGPMDTPIGEIPGVKEEATALAGQLASDMRERPRFFPDSADLATFRTLREKAKAIGGHDREMWEKHGWLDKDHWSL
jgi:multimeric flavodoxin WrbA